MCGGGSEGEVKSVCSVYNVSVCVCEEGTTACVKG